MIRTIFFFTCFWLVLILSLPFSLIYLGIGILGFKQAQRDFLLFITKRWAQLMIFITGNKIISYGEEAVPPGPVLFVVNHQSNFDIPACLACLPHFAPFIAKVELEKIPVLSWWMKKMGCFFMDRSNMRQSLNIILEGIEVLKGGQSLVIFPEGTRARDGVMMDFKPGSLKLATKAGVPIVPVTIKNTFKVFEEHNRIRKADVSIIFHDAIDTTLLSRDDINQLHVTVRDIIKSSLER